MNAATTEQEHSKAECGKRKAEKLFPGDVCREHEGKLESHAADLLGSGLGIDARAESKGHNADGGFSGLGFSRRNGNVELDKLKGDGPRSANLVLPNVEAFRAFRDANGWRANAGDLFYGIICAVVNFCEGLGNKVAEVHGC